VRKVSRKKSLIEKVSEKFTKRMDEEVDDISPEEVVTIYQSILITELIKELGKDE